ncbi:AVT2 protein, partial [Pelecanoides urinatrix]|nr:AVT2 protein [Pelecanoides urinatrix]
PRSPHAHPRPPPRGPAAGAGRRGGGGVALPLPAPAQSRGGAGMERAAGEGRPLLPAAGSAGLSSAGAVFILLKSALGAGLLSFPWAFGRAGGAAPALLVELGSLVFLVSGLAVLGYAAALSAQPTYQGVVRAVCGAAVPSASGGLTPFALRFLPPPRHRASSWASVFSVIPTICFGFQVGHPSPTVPGCRGGAGSPPPAPRSMGTPSLVGGCREGDPRLSPGVAAGQDTNPWGRGRAGQGTHGWGLSLDEAPAPSPRALQCHEACVAIYSSMRNQSFSHWVAVSVLSMLICLLIYSLTGLYGYLTFGEAVASDVLMSYPGNDPVIIIARLLFGVSIVTIYPIVVLLGRSVVRDVWVTPKRGAAAVAEAHERRSRVVLTVAWMAATLAIALFVPDIGKVIELIGGISAFFIFIFPG